MNVTPLDLRQQKFKTVMRGYDRAEVESFLAETAEGFPWAEVDDGIYEATLAGPFDVPADVEVIWAGLWDGSTYLDKAPAFAATVDQEVVYIDSLRFVVADPEPISGPGA